MTRSEKVEQAVDYIRRHQPEGWTPQAALVLGSGLNHISAAVEQSVVLDYTDIPHFIRTRVEGHGGKLHLGWLGGAPIVCLQGRQHLYEGPAEGIEAWTVAIRAMRALGVNLVFLTAAAGSLNKAMPPGSLMMVADHINLTGHNPLTGPNDPEIGPRFPNMSRAYDPDLRRWLLDIAISDDIPLIEGVYVGVLGPNFETPAEVRMMQMIGGDAVGMSLITESLLANHGGMRVVACSAITNYAEGIGSTPPTHEETLAMAEQCSGRLTQLLFGFFESLA